MRMAVVRSADGGQRQHAAISTNSGANTPSDVMFAAGSTAAIRAVAAAIIGGRPCLAQEMAGRNSAKQRSAIANDRIPACPARRRPIRDKTFHFVDVKYLRRRSNRQTVQFRSNVVARRCQCFVPIRRRKSAFSFVQYRRRQAIGQRALGKSAWNAVGKVLVVGIFKQNSTNRLSAKGSRRSTPQPARIPFSISA